MASTSGGGEPKSSSQVPGGESSGGGEVIVTTGSGAPLSRYESQKRRDWNKFLQYLKNHRPPLSLAACSGAHVIEFLRYLDQFGKTKVHLNGCKYFGNPNPPALCACPLRQAWGGLDALIGRLRDAYEENGGTPETNPFGSRSVRVYLREVRDVQSKSRGINYMKKKRKSTSTTTNKTSTTTTMLPHAATTVHSGDADDLDGKVVTMSLEMADPVRQEHEDIDNSKIEKSPTSPKVSEHGEGKAVSIEEKSGIGELVSMSSELSGPVSQEHEGSSSSKMEETLSFARISESDKLKAASVEEKSGLGEVFSMPSKMSDRYDNTGKLLPINSEKQHELIPTAEENVDVRANIIFLDRDYLEESDPRIPSQQETSSPTVPPPNLTQEEDTGTVHPKRRKLFKLFPWLKKK